VGTFAGPVLAMMTLIPVLEEAGPRAAATVYAASALLALLLVPDVELSFVFAAFGWYPILRPKLARIPSRLGRLAARLLICNALLAVLYGLVLRLLGLTADLEGASFWINFALLVLGNLLFLLLDPMLDRLTALWRRKLRKRFFS
jgi:hypothetical protein